MKVAFELSMPSNNSWNGKWSGEGRKYVRIRSIRKPESIVGAGYFTHSFGDGWVAGVTARAVDDKEARKLERESKGFCGYDWMIDSIVSHGEIRV